MMSETEIRNYQDKMLKLCEEVKETTDTKEEFALVDEQIKLVREFNEKAGILNA